MNRRDIPPHETHTTALVEVALRQAHDADGAIATIEGGLRPDQRSGANRLAAHQRGGRIISIDALAEIEALLRMTERRLADAPSEQRCVDMSGGLPTFATVYAEPAHGALADARDRLDALATAIRSALTSAEAERVALRLLDGDRELTRVNQPRG